jgi:ferredoxin
VTTKLFYFTGTGNTLWVGKTLCDLLPGAELVPLLQLARQDEVVIDAQRVGFLFPLYYLGLPEIVHRVVSRADLSRCEYLFGLATVGGLPFAETGGAQGIRDVLRQDERGLDAFYYVWMPGNYLPGYGAYPKFVQRVQLGLARRRVARIARWVQAQAAHVEWGNRLTASLTKRVYADWMDKRTEWDRAFRVGPQCNSCRLCERACPVDNIALLNGKPTWLGRCQQCLACIQLCPQQAIEYGDATVDRKRYRHPKVRVQEIIDQKKGS